MQVLSVSKRYNLLLKAERIDERFLFFLDRVFVSAIDGRLLKAELMLLVLSLYRGQLVLSLHHGSGHISMEAHCVGTILSIRNCTVVSDARLSAATFDVL